MKFLLGKVTWLSCGVYRSVQVAMYQCLRHSDWQTLWTKCWRQATFTLFRSFQSRAGGPDVRFTRTRQPSSYLLNWAVFWSVVTVRRPMHFELLSIMNHTAVFLKMSQLSNHINLWTTATGAVSWDAVCARKGGVVKAHSDVQIAVGQLQVKSDPQIDLAW